MSTPDFVAVAATPEETPDVRARLADALTAAGIPDTEPQLLSSGGPVKAAQAEFKLPAHAGPGAVRSALQGTLGTHGDICVMPLANRKKRLLICDMDSTVIGQECLDELADYAGLKAEISAITERAMRGELNFEEALTGRVGMLNGLGLDALQQCFDERISLNAGARTLVKTMEANGATTLLVSGGFTFFTSRVADEAGFGSNFGNTLIDDGEKLTGKVGMPILGREAKLTRLDAAAADAGLTRDDALAMGDGANDLAMIEAAGLGIAFEAKPIVAEKADAAINHTGLISALFFQGYSEDEFVS